MYDVLSTVASLDNAIELKKRQLELICSSHINRITGATTAFHWIKKTIDSMKHIHSQELRVLKTSIRNSTIKSKLNLQENEGLSAFVFEKNKGHIKKQLTSATEMLDSLETTSKKVEKKLEDCAIAFENQLASNALLDVMSQTEHRAAALRVLYNLGKAVFGPTQTATSASLPKTCPNTPDLKVGQAGRESSLNNGREKLPAKPNVDSNTDSSVNKSVNEKASVNVAPAKSVTPPASSHVYTAAGPRPTSKFSPEFEPMDFSTPRHSSKSYETPLDKQLPSPDSFIEKPTGLARSALTTSQTTDLKTGGMNVSDEQSPFTSAGSLQRQKKRKKAKQRRAKKTAGYM